MAKLINQDTLNDLNIDSYERAFALTAFTLRSLLISETPENRTFHDSVQLVTTQNDGLSASGVFMCKISLPFNQLLFLANNADLVAATQSVIPDAIPVLAMQPLEPSAIATLPSIPATVHSLEQYLVWLAKTMLGKMLTQVQQNTYADNVGEFQAKNFGSSVLSMLIQ